jgi:leader peptidase (prepilin peptidase) / N-methyltransferase
MVVAVSEIVTTVVPAPLRPTRTGATAVAAACAAVAVVARNGVSGWSLVEAAAAAVLVWLAAIDLETRLLPNRITLPATGVLLTASLALGPTAFLEHALSALLAGGFLFAAAAIRPGDLGMGDAKLALLLGALLGTAVLGALVIGFCLVAAAGLVLLGVDGRAALTRHLPLGPFLAAGALTTLLLG